MTIELLIAGLIAALSTVTTLVLLVKYTYAESEAKLYKASARFWKSRCTRSELQQIKTPRPAATESEQIKL